MTRIFKVKVEAKKSKHLLEVTYKISDRVV